jgi:hypothetical protein
VSRDRDRDRVGRPRNARPRDALGRPLSRATPHEAGQPRIPDDLTVTGYEAARLADELLRAGRPFHAHEVLEASWKSGPRHERDLWQGLAQVAVGLTHAHRGNARGAVTLLRRGAERVRAYQAQAGPGGAYQAQAGPGGAYQAEAGPGGNYPYGMDLAAVLAASDELASVIERQGLPAIPPADLSLPLLRADLRSP